MSDTPSIKPAPDGPLVARDIPKLTLANGTVTRPKDGIALCRCGQTSNMPFCDGEHKLAKFDGTPNPDTPKRDRIYHYKGDGVTVHFSKLLCSHAGECGKRARAIFNTKQQPWVQPDEGTLDQIKEVVEACPSGALRYSIEDNPIQLSGEEIEIKVEPNGPYHVHNIAMDAEYWAEGQSEKKYVLCRCGLSKNKPFCDGTHYDEGWKSSD